MYTAGQSPLDGGYFVSYEVLRTRDPGNRENMTSEAEFVNTRLGFPGDQVQSTYQPSWITFQSQIVIRERINHFIDSDFQMPVAGCR